MILYHFQNSPFARRVRLVLELKGLRAELREARAEPEHMNEVRRLNPMHTVPVLVHGERVISDSTAICAYLDRLVPSPPLWPSGMAGADAVRLTTLCDAVLDPLIDLGLRYNQLRDHPSYMAAEQTMVGRAQRGLEQLASEIAARDAGDPFLCGGRWSAGDIAVLTLVHWLEGLPTRAATFATARAIVDLGWSLPSALSRWAALHAQRADVLALR
jgi:glutathione S-transferase